MFGMSISRQSAKHYYSPPLLPRQFPCFAYFTQIFFTAQRFDTSVLHRPPTPPPLPTHHMQQAFCIIAKSYYAVAFRVFRFVLHTLRLVETFTIFSIFFRRIIFLYYFAVFFLYFPAVCSVFLHFPVLFCLKNFKRVIFAICLIAKSQRSRRRL